MKIVITMKSDQLNAEEMVELKSCVQADLEALECVQNGTVTVEVGLD